MGKIIERQACDVCGSDDNVAVYDDGSRWCYTPECKSNATSFKSNEQTMFKVEELPHGTSKERQVSAKVAEFFGVRREVSTNGGTTSVYYPYYEGQDIVGYKQRMFPKDFRVKGRLPTTLFGQHCFPSAGKRIVITEGEEDTLAIAEAYNQRGNTIYPVVSIPSSSNLKAVVEHREYLRNFEEVILFVDTDAAGEIALGKLANTIGYDKVKVAKSKYKDASEALTKGGPLEVVKPIWDATPYSPQGILTGEALWDKMVELNSIESVPFPECFSGLNEKIRGMRMGEITLWVSGTGAGKSTMLREIVLNLVNTTEDTLGIISLEESPAETTRKLAGMVISRNPQLEDISVDDLRPGFDKFKDRVMVLDHCGSMSDGIVSQLEYMALSGCKYLFIDHITLLVSEGAEGLSGNEATDKIMNDLLRISKQHNVWIGLVSHLRKMNTPGKSFEAGELPTVDDIRGSGSIKQISHDIIAFARNITAETEEERNKIKTSVLKSRFTGQTGPAGITTYNADTGRLSATLLEEAEDF